MNPRLERLADLAGFLKQPAAEFIAAAKSKLGITLMVVRGYEDAIRQMERYKIGREKVGDVWQVINPAIVVTHAAPGQSGHNVISTSGKPAAVCLDVIPLDQKGRPLWALPEEQPHQLAQRWIDAYGITEEAGWARLYELSWKYGLDPLGDRTGAFLKWDKGHFEEPGWKWKLEGLGLLLPTALWQQGGTA